MQTLSSILTIIVAIEHVYFLVLEMFLWTHPTTMRAFGLSREQAMVTKTLAANQGLYNGFLAAGLVVGVVATNADVGFAFKSFFLLCVVIAGIYGGATVKPRIAQIQALPALVALLLTLAAGPA